MKQNTLLWVIGAIVVFYLFSKSQAAASQKLTENEYYAGTAAGVIDDLF